MIAAKLREYYLRGIRDARIEIGESCMPSLLEEFDAGDFSTAPDRNVWIKIAKDIIED
ncbi:MAG: hypothetical protein WC942_03495 [Clostridia bacterium]